jgi:hypothetical protein
MMNIPDQFPREYPAASIARDCAGGMIRYVSGCSKILPGWLKK